MIRNIRIGVGFALFAVVVMGAFGVPDSHQAKLPMAAIVAILGTAAAHRYAL